MKADPDVTPVTTPDAETVAVAVLLLLQVPPVVASARVVTPPGQTTGIPVMAAGFALTVTILVAVPALAT
jgi:hypothetical protein